MKRARTESSAGAPALEFRLGSRCIQLSRADVDRHAGSLLHSLVSTDSEARQQICVDLDSDGAAESPLNTWSHALDVTAALYRGARLPLDLVSDLLKTHSTADLQDNLQSLLDYLLLPGPLSTYLPPRSQITLCHLGVLDMHYAAAVRTAVQCIMSHSIHHMSVGGSVSKGTAHFFIQDQSTTDSVDLAVWMLTGVTANKNSSTYELYGKNASVDVLPAHRPAPAASASTTSARCPGPTALSDLIGPCSAKPGVDNNPEAELSRRFTAALSKAVSQVSANGRTGVMQAQCVQCTVPAPHRTPCPKGPVWVIQWQLS